MSAFGRCCGLSAGMFVNRAIAPNASRTISVTFFIDLTTLYPSKSSIRCVAIPLNGE